MCKEVYQNREQKRQQSAADGVSGVVVVDLNDFVLKLEAAYEGIEKQVGNNLRLAGAYLLRQSQMIVPVQTGNLKASGFVRATGSGIATVVTVGYTASYALFVHEMVDNLHGQEFNITYADKIAAAPANDPYWFNRGPDQQALFLSTVIETKKTQLQIHNSKSTSSSG